MAADLSVQEMMDKIRSLESELAAERKRVKRLHSLFNTMNEGVCLHELLYDSAGKPVDYMIIDVNPSYEKITGIRKKDAVNKKATILYNSTDAPFLDIYANVVETGKPESFEVFWPPMQKNFFVSVFSPEQGQFATVFLDITKQKEQEDALRLSEEHLSTTLNSIGDGVITTDRDGNITYMNPVAELLTGYPLSGAFKSPLGECYRIYDHETGKESDNLVLTVIHEARVIRPAGHKILVSKDGTRHTVDESASPIKGKGGELIGVVLIFRDITDIFAAENAIKEGEARLKSIFRAAPTGIGFVSERVILEVNDKLCEITGYKREELINNNSRLLYPDDADYEYVGMEKYRQIQIKGTGTVETSFKRKDGKIIHVLLSSTPVDQNDLKAGVTFTALDITARKLTIEALKESEEKYRRLAENSPDMIYRMSIPDGRYEYVSNASESVTGYKPEDFYRDPLIINKMIHHEWKDYFIKSWQQLIEGKLPSVYEYQIIDKNGETRWLNQRNILVTDDSGTPVAIEGMVTDITNAKKLETQLIQSQKMESIGKLAGGIAHDFNNILSPIMIFSELAMMNLAPDDPVQQDIRAIYRSCERARDLVRQILTFARKSDNKREHLHVSTSIRETIKFLRSTIPRTIDIRFEKKTDKDIVHVDKTRLNQVILNLFTNASHAMRKTGGVLQVTLSDEYIENRINSYGEEIKPGNYLRLSVSDTGEGISRENMNRLFEPYFTTKAPGEGTGMGLSVVHGIVKGYDGDISVESSPDTGTIFNILLPLSDTATVDEEVSERKLVSGKERILYIDDEADLIKPVTSMLEKLGYSVTSDTSSINALDRFGKNPFYFDLVITDQTMPEMSGKDLAARLKSIRSDIPVILCTGYSDQINEESALKEGINAFVIKPMLINEISQTIRDILDASRAGNFNRIDN